MLCIVKKTLKTVIGTGNDYVVKVKGNQPNLLKAVKQTVENPIPADYHKTGERSRGRFEKREVFLFDSSGNIPDGWSAANRIIYVKRRFETPKGLYESKSYYISSVGSDKAGYFAEGIRGHRYIENKLHYVKDVIMNEDTSGIKNADAAANLSIFRNIAINVIRKKGFDSVKNAVVVLFTAFFSRMEYNSHSF